MSAAKVSGRPHWRWMAVLCLGWASAGPAVAQLSGYLVDSSGNAVRTGSGSCVRSGSWSAASPGVGCDAQPARPDRVILLPDAGGGVGAVVVRSAAGERLLDKAHAGLDVDKAGGLTERTEDAASVQKRYGATLGAHGPRPTNYVIAFVRGAELAPESAAVFEEIKADLARRPVPEITVIGHTDRVGSLEANDRLSLQRAQTVRDALVRAGVKAHSIEAAGRGEREPAVLTADEVAETRNRRVEIQIR